MTKPLPYATEVIRARGGGRYKSVLDGEDVPVLRGSEDDDSGLIPAASALDLLSARTEVSF